MDYIIIFLITLVSGVLSGMGIGGGTILVVGLTSFLGSSQLFAQGINILTFVPVAFAAVIVFIKRNQIDFKSICWFLPFSVIGAFAGSLAAFYIDTKYLRYGFAMFVLSFGVWMILGTVVSMVKKRRK